MSDVCYNPNCSTEPVKDGLCAVCREWAYSRGYLAFYGGRRIPARRWLADLGYKPKRPVGEVYVTKDGYALIQTGAGTMPHHRFVMEQHLGRSLAPGENIHHMNGVRDDNRLENLELWYSAQPYGQRVSNLIAYMAEFHRDAMIEALWADEPLSDSRANHA